MKSESSAGRPSWRLWLRRAAQALLVVTTLGACFAIGAWSTLSRTVRVQDLTVPQLVGLDRLEAGRILRDRGLEPQIGGTRADPMAPEGRVLEQFPSAGSTTRPGRPVRLVVSSGQSVVRVPELVGSSLRRSQIALRKAGLSLAASAAAPNPRIGVGRVVAQHPPAGHESYPGEGATILFSAGAEPADYVMPSVVGRTVAGARAALERVGFTRVRLANGISPTSRLASVVAQSPRPGHRVTLDTTIVLEAGYAPLRRSRGEEARP